MSAAPALASPIVTPAKGVTAASEAVAPPCVPEIVGATAGSMSVTVVALSVAAVPALLASFSVNVVVADVFG